MSNSPSSQSISAPEEPGACGLRFSLLCIFISAGVWAVIGSAFALIASIKFHQPNFLADCSCLTYGRIHPAALTATIYGLCIQAALGAGLWLFTRLGRTALVQPWLVIVGIKLWNLGVLVGVGGILFGHGTGFEFMDMPGYAAWILILGYLLVGVSAVLTFHNRTERSLEPSQWFLLAALFWFPWIFSTAQLLVVTYPVRGIAQAAIWWWYQANLTGTFFTLAGIATIFYFVPKLTNHELHSRYLALFTFWLVILFGGWSSVPGSAPLPVWMPTISTIAAVLLLLPTLTVAQNIHWTMQGKCSGLFSGLPLRFFGVGMMSFVLAAVLKAAVAVVDVKYPAGFSWLTPAVAQLNYYGFFAMVMFGAAYAIIPKLMGSDLLCPKLMKAHFWLALLGILFCVVPLAIGGALEISALNNPAVPFLDIVKSTLKFFRISTMGDLLIAVGNILFFLNMLGVAIQYYRPKAKSAYGAATAELFTGEATI